MIEALIASVGYACGVAADKVILARYRVPVLRFIPLLFIWLAVITAVFLPLWGRTNFDLLHQWHYIGLFVLMIVVAVCWNILYYHGLQSENLAEFELIMLFAPLATVMFAGIFLPSERNAAVFGAGLVSSLAMVLSRFRRHHLRFSRAAKRSLAAMLLMSFESILVKELLSAFSPVSLYFARTLVIALVFVVIYRPKLLSLPKEAYALTVISAIFGVMQMVLKFYGFQNLGVVETTMILLLGPFFVYGFSYFYFKEKLYKRDIIALTVTVLSILYIEFWR